ncbi:MAG TPA: ABATE domain-containing protein [Gemmatimonadaceae bacterium]|nr:ABATE domain-containing protein [Gemmatimonadaceae bacterium]
MAPHRFELLGGDPALDFLNTVHDYTREPRRDYLPSFDEALRWGVAAGLLSAAESRRVAALDDGAELGRLTDLRSMLERIASALVSGTAPASADLDALSAAFAEAASAARLSRARTGTLQSTIATEDAGAAVLRLRVVNAAMELLTSARAGRMKRCAGCGWFFVDETKNKSRRWCSMATCGASAKSRRYYRKTRARQQRGRVRDR